MVEGTPLLRVQVRKGLVGSNPILSATFPHVCNVLVCRDSGKSDFRGAPVCPEIRRLKFIEKTT